MDALQIYVNAEFGKIRAMMIDGNLGKQTSNG